MSEKTQEKSAAKPNAAAKDGANKEKAGNVVKAKDAQKKEVKVEWTLERCMKYARGYPDEAVWASDSPASYKSALANGWRDQCVQAMKSGNNNPKVIPGKFPSRPTPGAPSSPGMPHKKAA
jgi:hypothetical protein